MKNYLKAFAIFLLVCFFVWLMWYLVHDKNIPMLEPQGLIAQEERNLMYVAALLMLAITIPVFALTGIIAWRYRATNRRAKYLPNWEHNLTEEFIWWAVPCIIIIILASITWKSSHDLDPFAPLPGETLRVQVVALTWKWLFIYPEEGVATVNFLEIPVGRPVAFSVTSDAPMNSFWIPQLGGQIYAMTGMVTKLHLVAGATGEYFGASANLSGEGFSKMTFTVKAVPEEEFQNWIIETRKAGKSLDYAEYLRLREPSTNESSSYSGVDQGLFEAVIEKYMPGGHDMHNTP